MNNLETCRTHAEGVLRDIAIQMAKHMKDPNSTIADGDRMIDNAIVKARTAATMLSLAKRNAALIPIAKNEPVKESTVSTTKGATLREQGERELDALACEIQKRDGGTIEKAHVLAQQTAAGKAALAKYYHPLRDEPITDAIRKGGHYERFGKPGDALAEAAQMIAARDQLPYVDALRKAEAEYPDLAWLYRSGDRW